MQLELVSWFLTSEEMCFTLFRCRHLSILMFTCKCVFIHKKNIKSIHRRIHQDNQGKISIYKWHQMTTFIFAAQDFWSIALHHAPLSRSSSLRLSLLCCLPVVWFFPSQPTAKRDSCRKHKTISHNIHDKHLHHYWYCQITGRLVMSPFSVPKSNLGT